MIRRNQNALPRMESEIAESSGLSKDEPVTNGKCEEEDMAGKLMTNTEMDVPGKMLNKQTLTPWDDGDACTHDVVSSGNSDLIKTQLTGSDKDPFTPEGNSFPQDTDQIQVMPSDVEGISKTPPESRNSANDVPAQWEIADDSSDWVVTVNGSDGSHEISSPDGKDSKSVWGDVASTEQPMPDSKTSDFPEIPSSSEKSHPSAEAEIAANPFVQDGSKFGGGFTDNFCEMSETDLIFRSGLVDEEFKTICVTAEEDDLWSSFAQTDESVVPANQSVDHSSWDPFPANQEPPIPVLNQETQVPVQSPQDQSAEQSFQTKQLSAMSIQTEVAVDPSDPPQQVPDPLQSDTSIPVQHSPSAVFPPEVETSIPSNLLSANENVQYDNGAKSPSNSIEAGSPKQRANVNVGEMLKDTAFREIILDQSWMAEGDCLETKAFTVDLKRHSLSKEAEDSASTMDPLADQTLPGSESQVDALSPSNDQGHQWMPDNIEISKTPADINANMEANGEQQTDILMDFGDVGTVDPKMVVAPPPEFDNNFDPLLDNAESTGALISINPGQSNGELLIDIQSGIEVPTEGDVNVGASRQRTPSDLDRLLNALGEGTMIDEEEDSLMADEVNSGDNLDGCEQEEDQMLVQFETDLSVTELPSQEGESAQSTDEAWKQMVIESSIAMQEIEPEQSANINALLSSISDTGEEINNSVASATANEKEIVINDGLVSSASDTGEEIDNSVASAAVNEEEIQKNGLLPSISDTGEEIDNSVASTTANEKAIVINGGPLSSASDTGEKIDNLVVATTVDEEEIVKNDAECVEAEPKVSAANTKLDLDAKRRSFFEDHDSNSKDSTFQPKISDITSPSSSFSLSSALPAVPVLPKLQVAYQRPESFYETKPRAATDSIVPSHALLGLGGDQAISTHTKPRSASEPASSSVLTTADLSTTSEGVTSPRTKDPSIAEKSTKFIRALYGPKPGSKSSELVDEDGKTLFEYEQERRDVLAAMKVKRKKKVSWKGDYSQSEDQVSPDGEECLSPTEMSNSAKVGLSPSSRDFPSSHSEEGTTGPVISNQALKTEPKPSGPDEPVVNSSLSVLEENTTISELEKPHLEPVLQEETPNAVTRDLPRNAPTETSMQKSPTSLEDNLVSDKAAETNATALGYSTSPREEPQAVTQAVPSDISKSGPAEDQNENNDETPIDLKKMRNLWEQKVSISGGIEVDDQKWKKSLPKRVFSFEAKAQEEASTKEESQVRETPGQHKDIPAENARDSIAETMPKDLDDDFDRCGSYTYEVAPRRRTEIKSHWDTSESIIQREIRQQKEREQELLKQGILKRRTDQTATAKETQVQLVKRDDDKTGYKPAAKQETKHKMGNETKAQEQQRILKVPDSKRSDSVGPRSPSKLPTQQDTPSRIQPKSKVIPAKEAEPEIIQHSVQLQESLPQGVLHEDASEPVVLIKERNDQNTDSPVKEGDSKPIRKESIVQREVRLQKERDEQNKRERQQAMQESRIRRASLEATGPLISSGPSTPDRTPQSPINQSATFTPIKPSSQPIVQKTPDNPPTSAGKVPDKSPVVRFGLSAVQSDPYSSYREYQKMLRGRKTGDKTSEKSGPMKATEGDPMVKQSPGAVFWESPSKEPAQQRPPSPLWMKRPPSPLLQKPPSPTPHQATSPVTKPEQPDFSSQDEPDSTPDKTEPDSTPNKAETMVQREIRLAKEREAELQKQRAAVNPRVSHKKDFEADVPDVVIVEKSQVVETQPNVEKSQGTVRSRSVSSPEQVIAAGRRQRETPVERDIRLAEEREMTLRKERGLPLKPTFNTTQQAGHSKPPKPVRRPSPNYHDDPDSAYCLKTVNYYIEKEIAEERQRELALKGKGIIKTVSQYEEMPTMDTEETLSPVKKSRNAPSETLIEQEIRLQQEREEQYRREKGLLRSPTSPRQAEEVADSTTQGAGDGEPAATPAASAETPTPKYRPQRRSLVLAQQWEQMFK